MAALVLFASAVPIAAPLRYTGGLLGVRADVLLYKQTRRAAITISGVPVGGTLSGGASYDNAFDVTLDHDLERSLQVLRVAVRSVKPSSSWDRVFVVVRLPLFLGRHNITLWRQSHERAHWRFR